jgi:c(7)-type cytochrome triheme protein
VRLKARPGKIWLAAGVFLGALWACSFFALSIARADDEKSAMAPLGSAGLMWRIKPSLTVGLLPRFAPNGAQGGTGRGSGSGMDYSTFIHTSSQHAGLACNSCHLRTDNSARPSFPGHSACINCHGNQFFTSASPMCVICHADVNTAKAPLKSFPANFKERFNVKFDHAQHMNAAVRPQNGCAACHSAGANRGTALSIPASMSAHSQCYVCHTPSRKSASGRDLASCGVCHDQKSYARTSTNARAFSASFSHAKHGPRQRLECAACHSLTPGLPQGRQVSSPRTAEHFVIGGGQSCLTCHNGKRSFGGDLAFKDCRRCHTSATFRMPG